MNSPTPVIQIENLTYAYGRAEAVHDLSLTVAARPLLRTLRPQRRGQDHHHEVPA